MKEKKNSRACVRCGKKPYYAEFCRKCFCLVVERRIKYYLAKHNMIRKHDRLVVFDSFTKRMFEKVLGGLPVKIALLKPKQQKKGALELPKPLKGKIIVLPWTADHECSFFLKDLMKKKPDLSAIGEVKGIVKLFKELTEDELVHYAKATGISYKPAVNDGFLDLLEKKYKGTKFSFANAVQDFSRMIKEKG